MENKTAKLVFNAGIARRLIRDYNLPVIDIKADHLQKDKTIFVFKITPEFEAAFAEINEQIKAMKTKDVE